MNAAETTSPSSPPVSAEELRFLLRNELVERRRKNARYSLRMFAAKLGMAPSMLSAILNGRRAITDRTVLRVANALRFDERQRARYLGRAPKRRPSYRNVSLDRFLVISEWYHFAILELLKIEGFAPTPARIGEALGIGENEARFALERLVRTGFLAPTRTGYRDLHGGHGAFIQTGKDHEALRNLQIRYLEMAIERLRGAPPEERDNTAITMAIRHDRLPEAKRKLRELRRAFADDLESGEGKDRIYQLVIGFYPISKQIVSEDK
jgi:transcriptional regulator with XRE-family HTH domain